MEALADEIAGAGANPEIRQLACRIAEAQIDLRRVQHARHQLLSDNYNDFRANMNEKKAVINKPPRSELSQLSTDALFEYAMSPMPDEPKKSIVVESQRTKQLLAMDRYERRALSRRKFAIREFDAARRNNQDQSVENASAMKPRRQRVQGKGDCNLPARHSADEGFVERPSHK